MLTRRQFSTLAALGALSLLLALADATLAALNRDGQLELAQRQQFVQQTIALEGLYREIVKALAELGARGNDPALLDVLAAQGLSVTVNGAAPALATGVPGNGAAGK